MTRDCASCVHCWRPRAGVPVYCERWASPPHDGLAVCLSHAIANGRCGPQRVAWEPRPAPAVGETPAVQLALL